MRARVMKFVVGCNLEEFKKYYGTLEGLHNFLKEQEVSDARFGELGAVEESIIRTNSSHLIVWTEDNEIVGHAIWHPSSTDEHRKGDPRDKEDVELLRRLLGRKKDFVELHEIWLKEEHRRKGYGRKFFEFFEDFIRKKGYDSIVYYADYPAALAICRKRGYREAFLEKEKWHAFSLSLTL
jgi:GNAT superfamily N-acetyltransferase